VQELFQKDFVFLSPSSIGPNLNTIIDQYNRIFGIQKAKLTSQSRSRPFTFFDALENAAWHGYAQPKRGKWDSPPRHRVLSAAQPQPS
jgi:hypothetical protein